jgi:CHAT domain-containing protein
MGFALSGLGGWAERLVNDVRVSAFVGTLWQVNDELAARFARRFYDNLWAGMTLGAACLDARLYIRQERPHNSTWLAYALYGDPNVRITWGAAS